MSALTGEEIQAELLAALNVWKQHHVDNLTFLLNFRKQLGFPHEGPSPLDTYINNECQFTGYLTGLISSGEYKTDTYLYKYADYYQQQSQKVVKPNAEALEVECESNEIIEIAVKNASLEIAKPPSKEKFEWSSCRDDSPSETKRDEHDDRDDGRGSNGRGNSRQGGVPKENKTPIRRRNRQTRETSTKSRTQTSKKSGSAADQVEDTVLDAFIQVNPRLRPASDFQPIVGKKNKKLVKRASPWNVEVKPTMYAAKYAYADGTESNTEFYFDKHTDDLYFIGKDMYIGTDHLLYRFDDDDVLVPALDNKNRVFWW